MFTVLWIREPANFLEVRPEDKKQVKKTISLPVIQVNVDITSKTPTQEADKTDDEDDGNIQKHRSSTPYNELSSRTGVENPKLAQNDVHCMTAQDDKGDWKVSLEDQMTLFTFVHISSLPPEHWTA